MVSRLFMLSFLMLGVVVVSDSVIAQEQPAYNPVLKYPDLSDRQIGMQPIIDEEDRAGRRPQIQTVEKPQKVVAPKPIKPVKPESVSRPIPPAIALKPEKVEREKLDNLQKLSQQDTLKDVGGSTDVKDENDHGNDQMTSTEDVVENRNRIDQSNSISEPSQKQKAPDQRDFNKQIASLVEQNPEAYFTIHSFVAERPQEAGHNVTRVALDRALAFKNALIENEVDESLIDIRVHKLKAEQADQERVDVEILKRP